jgi:hypothetical protein
VVLGFPGQFNALKPLFVTAKSAGIREISAPADHRDVPAAGLIGLLKGRAHDSFTLSNGSMMTLATY